VSHPRDSLAKRLQPLRPLAVSALSNIIATGLAAVSGLISTAYMARHLPLMTFGQVVLLVTATNALAIFEGLRPVVIYEISRRAEQRRLIFDAAARINSLMAVACIVVGALIYRVALSARCQKAGSGR
jgi:O-antigen/teichoic acid export membrane protein